ncbi:uncharacterized protein LOC133799424 [Humulus lupulus]|uniref:uncharacterized protein LOC133799424 n=1 Tax=Humulus lupulus TaxID=3486 RepID=UPI002B41807C|nr:uncharacterized protein LOC133799424 [Humulus lupulus]
MASEYKDSSGRIRCPCVRCINNRLETLPVVKAHVFDWGFHRGYEKWIYHGEAEADVANAVDANDDDVDEMIPMAEDFLLPTTEEVEKNPAAGQFYDDLFDEIEAELYPGCNWISSLNFLAKLLHLKVRGKIPNKIFDELLKLLKLSFPKGNKIPSTYYEAKKRLQKLGLGYESIHVCEHDCCLFYKEHSTKETCPICRSSRWISPEKTAAKKVPHKVMRYFPLAPRLKRLYSSRLTAKQMLWHYTGKSKDDGIMRHPVDGLAWKDFDAKHLDFASEPRNVRLGLAADGFNPFGNMSQAYSMWPMVLANYNLPPWMCMKDNNFILSILIPGPKSPGKDMDIFLRPLVDELKELWVNGVDTRDSITNTMFKRFLPSNHRMRRDTQFDGQIERRRPPRCFTCEEILEQVNKLVPQVLGKHEMFGGVKRRRIAEDQNWRKKSIFYELDYWSSNTLKHNIDVMHVEKNVCDSLLGTILDNDKSKDTTNARHDLKRFGVRESLWIYEDDSGKLMKPHAPYVLTSDQRMQFCKFIRDVKFPDNFCSNLKKKVNVDLTNINGLKSHDSHVIMQRLLSVGVRKFLSKSISTTISELCNIFRQICARTIKNYVGNKARPKGSIAEGYVADEALTYCSVYFKGVETRFNRLDRNEDEVTPRNLFVFQSQCRPITKETLKPLDRATREQAECEHLEEIKHKYQDGDHNILHKKYFQRRFHKKIYDLQKLGSLDNGDELLALASGSDHLGAYYEGCIVNGVRFMSTKRDLKRSTQNSGVFVAGTEDFNYYGILEEVLKLTFTGSYSVTLFKCKWFNTDPRRKKIIIENNITSINTSGEWYKDDPYKLANQVKQVFYLDDLLRGNQWKVVEGVNHRQIWDVENCEANSDVDVVHDISSLNFVLTVDLGELVMLPTQNSIDISTVQNLNVSQEDHELGDEEANEELDEEDDLLIDFCEDDANVNLVNDESDSDY